MDGAFVLDFYLADRPVLEATIHRLSYDFRTRPFEYVVFARDGLRRFLPAMTTSPWSGPTAIAPTASHPTPSSTAGRASLLPSRTRIDVLTDERAQEEIDAGAPDVIDRYNPSLNVRLTRKTYEDTPP